VLLEDGVPHPEQLSWEALGPLDLGLGSFLEVACLDRGSGALLVTDALVAIPPDPPPLFDLDPTPLLFHARERGSEPLRDDPALRRRGWQRLVLFASYLRPAPLDVPPLGEVLRDAFAPGCRSARSHFGLYPFRWRQGWEREAEALMSPERRPQVAAVLERLVFPRQREALVAWLRRLAGRGEIRWLVPAHYAAPVPIDAGALRALADGLEQRDWAVDGGSWAFLAGIDRTLVRSGLVPGGR
jgi:hypothetical protein